MKKKILTILIAILTAAILCFTFSGCFDFGGNNSSVGEAGGSSSGGVESIVKPTFTCEYHDMLGYYVTVTGALKNTSKNKYTYVSITFSCYDENGYNIGTCMDNLNYLGSGEIWQYKATSLGWFDKEVKRVTCTDITYF